MKANLHVHSRYSDGTKTIEEIDELARNGNFSVVAITDHDTVNAVYDLRKIDSPVKYIIGVEMSCNYKDEGIHILGYFNHVNDSVINYFQKQEKKLLTRCMKIINNLKKYYDIEISYDDVRARADGIINSSHVASEICDKYGYGFQEVYDKFLGVGKKAYVPKDYITLEDAIKYLHDNGALVVLAHPILIKKFNFEEVIDLGFDGIEVYHPDQDEEFSKRIYSIAKRKKLLITGGSDYHGEILDKKFEDAFIEGKSVEIFLNKLLELN